LTGRRLRTKDYNLNQLFQAARGCSLANNELDGWTTPNSRNEATKLQEKIMKKTISILAIAGLILALAPAAQAALITGMTTTSSAYEGTRSPDQLTDGSGMSGDLVTPGAALHTPDDKNTTMWLSSVSTANTWVKVDLGSSYTVDDMYVWNFQESSTDGARQVLTYKVYYSTNEAAVGGDWGSWMWNEYAGPAQSLTTNATTSPFAKNGTVDMGDVTARVIGLEFLTVDVGGNPGLSELQFDGTLVPEPATMSLLAIGGIALIRRRRK
jgi:hypothetical protein